MDSWDPCPWFMQERISMTWEWVENPRLDLCNISFVFSSTLNIWKVEIQRLEFSTYFYLRKKRGLK